MKKKKRKNENKNENKNMEMKKKWKNENNNENKNEKKFSLASVCSSKLLLKIGGQAARPSSPAARAALQTATFISTLQQRVTVQLARIAGSSWAISQSTQ